MLAKGDRARRFAPLGWIRLRGDVERRLANSPLPPPIRSRLIALNLRSHLPRTMVAEGDGFRANLVANRAPPDLGNLPLIVLSEGKPNVAFMQERIQTWFQLQDELAHQEVVTAARAAQP